MTDQAARPLSQPVGRPAVRPVTRAFIAGAILGLVAGVGIGVLANVSMGLGRPSAWTDASGPWMRLPEQTTLGATLPQTFAIPASSYDYGGVSEPLDPAVAAAPGIVSVVLQARSGRVGVSLARPDGGELVSREAVVTPQQGKTTIYLHTVPGAGPVALLLRAADNNGAGVSATVSQVRSAPETGISPGQMDKINRAGVY